MTVLSDIKEIINNKELMEAFSGKRVLVTGASGLIGSMLIKTFDAANKEYDLHITIIGHARNKERTSRVLNDVIEHIIMVYSDDFSISAKCDYVFHAASPTSSRFFIEQPVETINAILDSTNTLLRIAKDNNATMIYISSMEEYGTPYTPGELMTEDKIGIIDHLKVRSCYPEAKRMCECMCVAYWHEYAVPTKITRLAQTFGAGIPLTDNRVSMQFAKSVQKKENIVLHTEGRSISNYCYISDAISGILMVAVKGQNGEAYNICNEEETRSIYDIAKLLADRVSKGTIEVVKEITEEGKTGYAPDNTMRLSSQKLRALGWKPTVGMEEGYRRLIEYLNNVSIVN